MIVLTADQRGSRRVGDQVDDLLAMVASWVVPDGGRSGPSASQAAGGIVRPFQRTVGDEVQAVLADPAVAVDLALRLLRLGGWSIGLGAGPVHEPLPRDARAGSGDAFLLAREAVERAKSRLRPVPIAVEAGVRQSGHDCEAVLTLLGAIMARRTTSGWAVIDGVTALSRAGGEARQEDVAALLGITQQAVSQRLRTAMWAEEQAVRPVAARLLAEGDG